MYNYYCSECFEQVTESCPEHPAAKVESIWIPTKAEILANCSEFCEPQADTSKGSK